MQPIRKSFHINVFIKKCPLTADVIEQFFELVEDENYFIRMMAQSEDNKS